jgi:hypothetical protein
MPRCRLPGRKSYSPDLVISAMMQYLLIRRLSHNWLLKLKANSLASLNVFVAAQTLPALQQDVLLRAAQAFCIP